MLSRKQTWRKQVKHIYRSGHEDLYKEGINDSTSIGLGYSPTKSQSEPELSQSPYFYLGKMWSTTGDLTNPTGTKRREVKFSTAVKVVLIPQREEYCCAGLDSLIWYTDVDYTDFKTAAIAELRTLMALDKRIDSKTAQKILYQPPQPKNQALYPPDSLKITDTSSIKFAKTDIDKSRHSIAGKIADGRALHPLAYLCN